MNVNFGEKRGMKRLLQHAVPFAVWIGCGNHKVALYFKDLLQIYPVVLAADATLLTLWNFFHYRPLATNFVKNAAKTYDERQVTQICPSVTRWTPNNLACKNLCDGLKQTVSALATCVNERKKTDALGISVEITSSKFCSTILMLRDVYAGVQPLNLALHKIGESLVLLTYQFI